MFGKIQYISQGATVAKQLQNIRRVLNTGCSWVQLRFKDAGADELMEAAVRAKTLCMEFGATFIVNDYVEVAKTVGADGVHLGLNDMAVPEAQAILGQGKIIGGTANTLEDARRRIAEDCDYIGLGPYRFTTTKEELSPVLGLEGYQKIIDALTQTERQTPIYAIGGIEDEDIEPLMQTGIHGIAVSGLLTKKPDAIVMSSEL